MKETNFYHKTIINTIIAFGNMFNSIEILRTTSSKAEYKRFKVPISYGPKQKYLAQLQSDPDLEKQKAISLPRMSFELGTFSYDPTRKLQTMRKNWNIISGTEDEKYSQYNPVPYNVSMDLHAYVEYADEGSQIVEQIIPYFTPDFTVTINAIPTMELKDDVRITLESISSEDLYEGSLDTRRTIIWNMNFTMAMNFYGPISNQGLIRKTITDFHIPPTGSGQIEDSEIGTTPRQARIVVEPDPLDAGPEDAYGYTTTITEYDDGKIFDPYSGTDISVGPNIIEMPAKVIKVITIPADFTPDPNAPKESDFTPNLIESTVTIQEPIIDACVDVYPDVFVLTLGQPEPIITVPIKPAVLTLTTTIEEPIITLPIKPAVLTLTGTLVEPTVVGELFINITPVVLELTGTVFDPSISGTSSYTETTLELTNTILEPSTTGDSKYITTTLGLTGTNFDPTITSNVGFTNWVTDTGEQMITDTTEELIIKEIV